MNLILFLFVILAATFIAGSVNNMVSVMTALDTFFEKAEVPNHLVCFADQDQALRFERFAEQENYSIRQQEVLQIDPKDLKKETGEAEYNNTAVVSRLGDSVRLFNEKDEEITQIKDGEVSTEVWKYCRISWKTR